MMNFTHKWIGIVSFLLYFSLAITAQANSLSIQTEFWEHQLRKELFHSGGTVQNLNSGFLFGMNKVHATPLPPKTNATAEGLKEGYKFLIGSFKKQNKTLSEEKERIKELICQKSFEIPKKEKKKLSKKFMRNKKLKPH